MTKKERIGVFCVGAILLAVFTFTDLQISQAVFTKNLYGRIFEVVGELPFVFLATTAACLLFRFRAKPNRAASVLLGILSAALVVLLAWMGGFMTVNYLEDNIGRDLPGLLAPLIGVLILVPAILLTRKVPEERGCEAVTYAITAVFYFIAVLIVMNTLKSIWGRMRMREMTDPLTQFTPWYVISDRAGEFNKYASFPSGHTMNSAAVILLTMLPSFLPSLQGKEKVLRTVAYVWIVLVGFSRVVMGAHFASDVTVGAMLSLALFDIISHLIIRLRSNKMSANADRPT